MQSNTTNTPYINVTPLIDVLLVLMIIFMVAAPLRPHRFKALIPEPNPQVTDCRPWPLGLRVEITHDAKLRLNQQDIGNVTESSALSSKLAEIFRQREAAKITRANSQEIEKTVFIAAPKSTKYGEVAKVIDAVKGAGAYPVGLQVDALEP